MPESEDPKEVSYNDLKNSQFAGGFINAEAVNAQRIGGDIWNIYLGQQTVASDNPARSQSQQRRLEQEKDSLEQAYTLQSEKVAQIRKALVIETDPSRKFQYEQLLTEEERALKELGDRLHQIEYQLQSTEYKTSNNQNKTSTSDLKNKILLEAEKAAPEFLYEVPAIKGYSKPEVVDEIYQMIQDDYVKAQPLHSQASPYPIDFQYIKITRRGHDFLRNEPEGLVQQQVSVLRKKHFSIENSVLESDTNIYVERPPIEEKCYKAIVQPGALIRIKAPQRMGKTLLSEKILDYARQQGYQTAKLDLKLADINILANLKTFLQWLCADVSDSLELEPQLDKYWQDIYGLNKNCTRYFQKYLLSVTNTPLVFAIDNFERLFEYPDIFPQFCLLLRGWYETAKQGDRIGNIWKKLRLVVVHSTEAYPSLDTNHSPFNVGLAIELPEFNLQQVEFLAKQYELSGRLGEQGLSELMELVGGHPYLVQQIIANLKTQQITKRQLLNLAPTEQGILSDHLRQLLWNLQHNPQLESAYKKVVMENEPVRLDAEVGFKLHSLGLVKLSGNDCVPSCNLYRQYFSDRLV